MLLSHKHKPVLYFAMCRGEGKNGFVPKGNADTTVRSRMIAFFFFLLANGEPKGKLRGLCAVCLESFQTLSSFPHLVWTHPKIFLFYFYFLYIYGGGII